MGRFAMTAPPLFCQYFEKSVDKLIALCYYIGALRETPSESEYGRVVELVDSLDSGSSVHCGRAGSSPASPTKTDTNLDTTSIRLVSVLFIYRPCRAHTKKYRMEIHPVFMCWHYLSSRQVTLQVLWARVSLTSVFGMGTGGPSPQSIPTLVGGY